MQAPKYSAVPQSQTALIFFRNNSYILHTTYNGLCWHSLGLYDWAGLCLLENIQFAAACVVTSAIRYTSHAKIYEESGWDTLKSSSEKHKLFSLSQDHHQRVSYGTIPKFNVASKKEINCKVGRGGGGVNRAIHTFWAGHAPLIICELRISTNCRFPFRGAGRSVKNDHECPFGLHWWAMPFPIAFQCSQYPNWTMANNRKIEIRSSSHGDISYLRLKTQNMWIVQMTGTQSDACSLVIREPETWEVIIFQVGHWVTSHFCMVCLVNMYGYLNLPVFNFFCNCTTWLLLYSFMYS